MYCTPYHNHPLTRANAWGNHRAVFLLILWHSPLSYSLLPPSLICPYQLHGLNPRAGQGGQCATSQWMYYRADTGAGIEQAPQEQHRVITGGIKQTQEVAPSGQNGRRHQVGITRGGINRRPKMSVLASLFGLGV